MHYITSWKVTGSIPNEVTDLIIPPALWALRSTQPLTEMSTRNLTVDKGRLARKADNPPPSVSQLSRKCGSLDISEFYGPPWPVTGIALSFLHDYPYINTKFTSHFKIQYLQNFCIYVSFLHNCHTPIS
jgi:hypothetical protein